MRNRTLPVPALVAAALLFLPPALHAQGSNDARAAIEAGGQKFVQAFNAGDGAAVAALYTEDAMLLPPGSNPVTGREAIQAFWQAGVGEGGTQIELQTKEVHAHGDGAVEVGGYVMDAADGSHVDHGKYIVVWKKVNGEWKLHRDIWNSSMGQ